MSLTDRNTYVPGALPTLGPAGTSYTDAVFGANVSRVTDGTTLVGSPNASWNTPGAGSQKGWNSDSTKFYLTSRGGGFHLFNWNPVTKVASYNQALPFTFDACFSSVNPNFIYGIGVGALYNNGHTLVKIDVSTNPGVVTTLVSAETIVPGIPNPSYVNAVAGANERIAWGVGATSQDEMTHVIWYPLNDPGGAKALNTSTAPAIMNTNHSVTIDLSGRYVVITPKGAIPYNMIVWDTTTDLVYPITLAGGGHGVFAYANCVNGDILTVYDGAQWIYRDLTSASIVTTSARELIVPLLLPKEVYLADHSSWNYSKPDGVLQPVTLSTYRVYDGPFNVAPNKNDTPFRAWDNEIISVATDGVDRTVWRHCHHRSLVYPDVGTAPFEFYYTPRVNVSIDGKWAAFTSNMEKSLGIDPYETNVHRRDVFIAERSLVGGGLPPPPPPPPLSTHRRHGPWGWHR